tara:strand:- start:444 stop:1208 length:765 start_codon:yes stop_codon:yes gene_type:complete
MSWYNGSFLRREQIAIDGSVATAGAFDLLIKIPEDWDSFWDNIRNDGNDVVVTNSDGTSIMNFQFRSGFNISDRNIFLQVQNYALAASNTTGVVFLYWNNPNQSTSLQTAHTPAVSTLQGYIYTCAPYGRLVTSISYGNAALEPQQTFSKEVSEEIDIWFPIGALLASRSQPYNQHLQCEEVTYVQGAVVDSGGSTVGSMLADEEIRVTAGWCLVRVKAGSTGNNYAVKLLVKTTQAQTLFLTCILQVETILPS